MFKILFISIWFFFHPVHVTLTSIDYIPGMGSFKVFVRMYFDDFLIDCKLNGCDTHTKDFESEDNISSQNVMEKYLSEKIIIKADKKILSGKLTNMKLEDNEISVNLEYFNAMNPDTITVKNLIMTDLHNDQSNMLIMRINKFEEGVKLTPLITERIFILK